MAADNEVNREQNCPSDNSTNARNNTNETAFEQSAEDRQEAIEGGECTAG